MPLFIKIRLIRTQILFYNRDHWRTTLLQHTVLKYTLLEKRLLHPHLRQWSNFCPSSGLKLTWNVPVTAPQQSPTLSWRTFTSMPSGIVEVQNRSCHYPKICLCTVVSSNRQLQIFSQFSLIIQIMSRPTPICIRHEVLALGGKGMWQSAIVGCVGLTRATVNYILRRHAATGTLVPGNSTGAPQKTTRQDCAFV